MQPLVVRVLSVVAIAATLAGCATEPRPSPNANGIPEARALAEVDLETMIDRVSFSDEALILGAGRADSCGYARPGKIGDQPSGYTCSMEWKQLVVIPAALTREEAAVALDAQVLAMGLPIDGTTVRDLVLKHPNTLDTVPASADGHDGDVYVSVETEPFRPDVWSPPTLRGGVSSSGDLGDVTAGDITATGATQLFTISASVEYWAEDGVRDLDSILGRDPDLLVEQSSHGDNHYFDLAQAQPIDAANPCLTDPMVAPTSLTRAQEPFPRVTFKLFGAATNQDALRVRDCLATNLSSGTVVWYLPYSRGPALPSPVPTPLPGPDPVRD